MRLGVLLGLAVFLVSTACAEDLGNPVTGEAKTAFLTTWSERLRSMRSLHMIFTQEKHLRLLRQALVAQGELWLKGETLLYVLTNTAGDKELTVRLDKQTVRTHYPLLHTLEVIDLRPRVPYRSPSPSGRLIQRHWPGTMRLTSGKPPDSTRCVSSPKIPKCRCKSCVSSCVISNPKNSCRSRKTAPVFSCTLPPSR